MIAMRDLTRAFTQAGCVDVQSVVQSGNVIFRPPAATVAALDRVRQDVQRRLGGEVIMLFRTLREVERLVDSDPFETFTAEPTLKLYVAFHERAPRGATFPFRSERERLEAIGGGGKEVFIVSARKPSGFYGFPNNFVEDVLGVRATTRNWSTIMRISALAGHD